MTKDSNRYDLSKVPISQTTRDSLDQNAINVLGTLGRMMSLQDLVIEEQFEEIKEALTELNVNIKKLRKDICRLRKDLMETIQEVEKLKAS